jgi:hypothetical protein
MNCFVQAFCLESYPMMDQAYLVNSSKAGSAQTESLSSKYNGFFPEASQDQKTIAQFLFIRNLRVNVALTFWRKKNVSELVAFLVRIEHLGSCGRLPSCGHQ